MAQTHSFNIHQTQSRKTQKYPLTRSNFSRIWYFWIKVPSLTLLILVQEEVFEEKTLMLIRFSISHTKQQQVLSLFSGKYRSKTHTSRRIEADLAPWEITLCWHLWEHLGDGNHFNFHIHIIYYHYRGSEWQILMSQIYWNTGSPE